MAVVPRVPRPRSRLRSISRPRRLASKAKLPQHPLGNLGSAVPEKPEPREIREARPAKTPRTRVNTAKQGAPQHLTASQRRKLVRLWTSTSLTLEEQGDLIAPTGTSALKTRSLRLHLRRILGENYPQWRPRDSDVRKRRARQLEKYYCMKRDNVPSSQENVLPQAGSVITPNAHQDSIEAHAVVSFTEPLAVYEPWPFDPASCSGNDSSRQWELPLDSGFNTDVTAWSEPPAVHEPWPFDPASCSGNDLDSGFNMDVTAWSEPFSTGKATCFYNSLEFSDDFRFGGTPYGYYDKVFEDVPSPSFSGTVDPRYLLAPHPHAQEFSQQSATAVSDEHVSNVSCTQLPEGASVRMKEGSDLSLGSVQHLEDQGQKLASHDVRLRPNVKSFAGGQENGLRISQLSDRLKRLSEHSLGERQAIKLLMRLSSGSMPSLLKDSVSACLHGSRISLKSIYSLPIEASRPKPPRNPGQWRLDMPGDFLTSQVNTFPHHIHCDLPAAKRQDLTVCDFCLYNPPSRHLRKKYGVPLTVIYFKRGEQVDEKVIAEAKDWSDRFGNSRLHIAAALGVKYSTLEYIIEKGANVNALNTGRQSFMHVIDPYRWSSEDMISLREHLKKQNFQFNYKDLQGLTFLDYLKEREMDPLCFAKCWLEFFIEKDSHTEQIMNYDRLKKLFEAKGGTQEQWLSLGWTLDEHWNFAQFYNSTQDDGKLQTLVEEVVQDPGKLFSSIGVVDPAFDYATFEIDRRTVTLNLVTLFSDYRSERNQNSLHLAVTASVECDSDKQTHQQLHFGQYGLEMVKALTQLHVDINHHDEFGETPIMALIRSYPLRIDVLEYLLCQGANPDARNREGDSALHLSVTLGNTAATETLIKCGANVHARNMKGLGVVAIGRAALEAVESQLGLEADIIMCIHVLLASGAVEEPTLYQEWDLRQQC